MYKVRSIIIKVFGYNLIDRINYILGIKNYNKFDKYKNKKKIIYTLVPSHGNMGDQAIAKATLKYLKDKFTEYEIIEIFREDTYKYGFALKKIVNKNDIIILHGGGNMGNLYPVEEKDRRKIIKLFPNNKIISMTQTMNFSNDDNGRKELLITKKVYNSHKNLTLIAREKKSYELMNRELDVTKVVLNPDIVLYLNDQFKVDNTRRKRIMTCLRSDKESVLGKEKNAFINELVNNYNDVFIYDTVISKSINDLNRDRELEKMFNEFLTSKVVITDRLHGMVFAAITKTPCIVTKSLDHKVTGTYEWIKDLNYIKLIDNLEFNNVKPIIDELCSLEKYSSIDLNSEYFSTLKSKIM